MDTQYLFLNWSSYHLKAQNLAAAILSHDEPLDIIVAIARGGLPIGHLLSDLLKLPISTITIQSYTDIKSQGEIMITEKLKTPISGKRVLLVDDVSDSGKTFVRAISYLKRFKPKSITTVTMFYKPYSIYKPDFYSEETSKWVLFPYEPAEMISLLTNKMKSEGKSKAKIQDFLTKLGYREDQILFVRKHYIDKSGV